MLMLKYIDYDQIITKINKYLTKTETSRTIFQIKCEIQISNLVSACCKIQREVVRVSGDGNTSPQCQILIC